mgnify:CR=1 FL=1
MTAASILQKKESVVTPESLIYEIMDGQPIYYRGYKNVLNQTKTIEEIMGCSTLRFAIINYLLRLLYSNIDDSDYLIANNEAGVHLDEKNNLSADIALFDWTVLTPQKVNKKYADVPPKYVIEVDISGEFDVQKSSFLPSDYVHIKMQKLLDFGVEKVIWIFSESQKITIAEPNKDWITKDWHQEIELFEGIKMNIGEYLQQKGITV